MLHDIVTHAAQNKLTNRIKASAADNNQISIHFFGIFKNGLGWTALPIQYAYYRGLAAIVEFGS